MPRSDIQKLRRRLNGLRRKYPDDISLDARVGAIRRNLELLEKGEGGERLLEMCVWNIAELAEFMKSRT